MAGYSPDKLRSEACWALYLSIVGMMLLPGCGDHRQSELLPTKATADRISSDNEEKIRHLDWYRAGLFDGLVDDPVDGLRVDGLPGEANCLAEEKNGTLWIGMAGAGIVRYAGGDVRLFDAQNVRLPDQGIADVLVDNQNVKWFCSTRGYIYSYDDHAKPIERWKVHATQYADLPLHEARLGLRCIRQHPDGTICILARDGLMKLQDGQWDLDLIEPLQEAVLMKDPVPTSMDIDAEGTFWIATSKGLFYGRDDRWTALALDAYGIVVRQPPGVSDVWYNQEHGIVYFTTKAGLCRRRDGRTELWSRESHGLRESHVTKIRGGRGGRFVLGYHGMDKGISYFDGTKWRHWNPDPPPGNVLLSDAMVTQKGTMLLLLAAGAPGLYAHEHGQMSLVLRTLPSREAEQVVHRMPWRHRGLQDVLKASAIEASVADMVNEPHKYYDQKIRIVSSIVKPAGVIELMRPDAPPLQVWPEHDEGLARFLEQSGWGEALARSETREYLGYLEYGGYFGRGKSASRQLYVVEVYPHGQQAAEAGLRKEDLRGDFLAWLDEQLHDSPVSALPQTEKHIEQRHKLQGKWDLVSSERRGAVENDPRATSFTIQWDRLDWNEGVRRMGYLMRLDPNRPMNAVDLTRVGSFPEVKRGIYQLEDDRLTMHLTDERSSGRPPRRPSSFQTSSDAGTLLLTFRRDPTFQVPKSRAQIKRDPPDWADKLRELGSYSELDALGRVYSLQLSPKSPRGDLPPSDVHLSSLKQLANLERLHVMSSHVSDQGVKTIGEISTLKYLTLDSEKITDEGVKHLKSLKRLEFLGIGRSGVTGKYLDQLADLPELTHLFLGGAPIDNENLPRLAKLPQLRHLVLPASITDEGLMNLRELRAVEYLVFDGSISDVGLVLFHLPEQTQLKSLTVKGEGITDRGFEGLERLSSLERLSLTNTRVGRRTLERFRLCPRLRSVTLGSTIVTDEDLALLAEVPQLTHLGLYNTAIAGDGLRYLSGAKSLRTLSLHAARINRAGIEHLKQLKSLVRLSLGHPKPPREVVNELTAALPATDVH